MNRIALTALLFVTLTTVLHGQGSRGPYAGDRVRVRMACVPRTDGTPCDWAYTTGYVGSLVGDTLVLQDDLGGIPLAVALHDVAQLDRFVVGHPVTGAVVGGLLGFAVGSFGLAAAADCRSGNMDETLQCGLSAFIAGGFLAALVGGAAGASLLRSRWKPVALASRAHPTAVVEATGSVRVGLAVGF